MDNRAIDLTYRIELDEVKRRKLAGPYTYMRIEQSYHAEEQYSVFLDVGFAKHNNDFYSDTSGHAYLTPTEAEEVALTILGLLADAGKLSFNLEKP